MKAKSSSIEKLSVSTMLASMDQKPDKSKKGSSMSSSTSNTSKLKAPPKSSFYTDDIDLPPYDEDYAEEGGEWVPGKWIGMVGLGLGLLQLSRRGTRSKEDRRKGRGLWFWVKLRYGQRPVMWPWLAKMKEDDVVANDESFSIIIHRGVVAVIMTLFRIKRLPAMTLLLDESQWQRWKLPGTAE
ncbi:ABC transporter F family member 4, partial [Olea europaea subsp. europaea]